MQKGDTLWGISGSSYATWRWEVWRMTRQIRNPTDLSGDVVRSTSRGQPRLYLATRLGAASVARVAHRTFDTRREASRRSKGT